MKRFCFSALLVATITLGGCEHGHDHTPQPATATPDAHPAHVTKYNEVLVEFPGHKYAMEIIDEKETTGLVTAYLTDAHFEPVSVDTNSVRLNFVVASTPTTYTLQRSDIVRSIMFQGQIATFTLTDAALATLICEGWAGEATAVVEIGGVPYIAPLIKLSQHGDHAH